MILALVMVVAGTIERDNTMKHCETDTYTLTEAKAIAKEFGHTIKNTGYDYKITGKDFPTGFFSDSLDDCVSTLRYEYRKAIGEE